MMCLAFDNPASRKIRAVIRFIHAKNMRAEKIHYELCAVCGRNLMMEETVRRCGRLFKHRRTNIHDEEEVVNRPSTVSDDLVQSVDQKVRERRRFTISELSCEFPQISRTLLYEIIRVRLDYHKFFFKMGSENAHGCA
jgi:hypothetical protein